LPSRSVLKCRPDYLASPMKSSSRDDVRYWHLADIQLAPVHVRLEVGTERRMFAGILDVNLISACCGQSPITPGR
jgi:hypothetical protein